MLSTNINKGISHVEQLATLSLYKLRVKAENNKFGNLLDRDNAKVPEPGLELT